MGNTMCGLLGVISRPGRFTSSSFRQALNTLSHRGPDSEGISQTRINDSWEAWQGHRRLSILDLSSLGAQPMTRRFYGSQATLIYNGEIYNYADLKKDMTNDVHFLSKSDTEVLLAGMLRDGPKFLGKANGMFSLALLDEGRQQLTLARDRLGKKPLYVYRTEDVLAFSSELKAFRSLGLPLSINERAMSYYRWLGYIPFGMTIYSECEKFPASSYQLIDFSSHTHKQNDITQYWDPLSGYANEYKYSYSTAIEQFLELLDDAVRIRLEADVPIGAFLSGGVDSSLVVSSLSKIAPSRAKAFTVKFSEPEYDESDTAITTARYLKTDLELLNLTSVDFERQVAKLAYHYDEPFSDSSQIPTMAISEAARRHATVVLTGDGGDEIFLGYPRLRYPEKLSSINRLIASVPFGTHMARTLINTTTGQRLARTALSTLGMSSSNLDSKLHRLKGALDARDPLEIYDYVVCTQYRKLLESSDQRLISPESLFSQAQSVYPNYGWEALKNRSTQENLAALDLVTYMRDDVLVKVDRATMAYSLEARCPLLDYRIVEFGLSLPFEYKFSQGTHKRILRDALSQRMPTGIAKLVKKGFTAPLQSRLKSASNPAIAWNQMIELQWRDTYS